MTAAAADETRTAGPDPNSAHERLVDFVLNARFDSLPAEAIEAASMFLMDTLAVGVAGAGYEGSGIALAAARRWGGGGDARVLGRPAERLPAASAALVNGYQIHCLEWDGLHEHSVVIALCAATGALVAEVERGGVSGRDLLLALAVGVEAAVLFGAAAGGAPRFFRPSVAGLMGAAMAVGKVRGFTRGQLLNQLGLAYSQVSGTMQAHWEGSMALALQVGVAARSAVTAADLVEAGMTGPLEVIDGRFGYFALIETPEDLRGALDALGRPWKVTELAHKPFPAGRATQATLTVVDALRREAAFGPDDISRVQVSVPPLIMLLVGRPLRPEMTPAYARLCLRFVLPLMLIDGGVDPRRFQPEVFADPAIAALADRIEIVLDGNDDPNAMAPQRIEIALRDGTRHLRDIDAPLGSPAHPLSPEQRVAKVRQCFALADVRLKPDALVAAAAALTHMPDARALVDACVVEDSASC